ncbi:MAG TPA: methyltransferase, partial [Verrucomicrobiae bacterium]|nr:methyltransferase [Verrucomicrobiae bacterium]
MYRGVNRNGSQYLEDLATGYWFSEVLFTAVELEIFTLIEQGGRSVKEISKLLDIESQGAERFLQALCTMGLLINDGDCYYNTKVSGEYLVVGKENYQGDSVLWRKQLASNWRDLAKSLKNGGRINYGSFDEDPVHRADRIKKYIGAMDGVAKTKVREMVQFFEGISLRGKILDVGAGSGAVSAGFLESYPDMTAALVDLPEVLNCTREMLNEHLVERVTFCPANILETWPVDTADFELIILSNIIHAYSEKEISCILKKASDCLKPGGFILIHDFFLEHYPSKAALFDLNMFVNTYNGKVFSHQWVLKQLFNLNLNTTELIPLKTDTALIIAA